MPSKSQDFNLSGPSHLTAVDWTNASHRMSVVASLVQGIYVMERDRQKKRKGSQALAPRWWKSFDFKMLRQLKDDDDSSIFGAIYKFEPPPASNSNMPTAGIPHCVIAFRGTLIKRHTFEKDFKLNVAMILNRLHLTPCFKIAIQAVRDKVASEGSSNVWLAGHSLGSAMALLAGKTMAETGVPLESFLFNSPYVSAPIERIKNKKAKDVVRIADSVCKAGVAHIMKKTNHLSADPFLALSEWVPCLYVNPDDKICTEYIEYFKQRETMEEIGLGGIGRSATQHSHVDLVMKVMRKESEPIHPIPSANLTVNLTPCDDWFKAHEIQQWCKRDLHLESKLYRYK